MTKNITTRIQKRRQNGSHRAVYIKVTALDVVTRDAHQFLQSTSLNTNYTENNFYKIKHFAFCFCVILRGIAKPVKRWATGWMAGVRFPEGARDLLLLSVQTGAGTHPASYPIGTGECSPGGKEAGA
jgi:hypothetical protein